MTKVYVLLAQGFGDSEDEFYTVGVYSTRKLAEQATVDIVQEAFADGLEDVETKVEEWVLDAK